MSHAAALSPSDSRLLMARARTNREAFGEVCERAYPPIFRYCQRRLSNRQAAEDITAEVFLHLARQIRSFPGQTYEEFLRWAYAIATNQANAVIRTTLRQAELLETAVQRGAIKSAHEEGDPSESAELDWPRVHRALLNLSQRDQSIVVLRFFEQLPFEEIAATLNMRSSSVRTAFVRALEKLRTELKVES